MVQCGSRECQVQCDNVSVIISAERLKPAAHRETAPGVERWHAAGSYLIK